MSAIRYQPEIDGLRAIAVVPVLLFHLDLPWAANGFMGVDVFFVISGYLISSIVLAEIQSGTFSFRRFWSRRIRRILPLTAVVVAATCVAAACLMFGPARRDVGWQSLASLGSVANIYFWRATGDYWGASAERAPLLHTWSLAVEEQFYVAFPFLAALLFKRKRPLAVSIVGGLIAASAAMYIGLSASRPAACFYLMPARAWELGIGVMLGLVQPRSIWPWARAIALPAGLLAVLGAYAMPEDFGRSGVFLTVPVIGAALVIAGSEDGATRICGIRNVLRSPILTHVGLLSFSLYLWHWPVFVFARYLNQPLGVSWVGMSALAATYVLSMASYRFVERPARSARNGVILAFAGTGAAALIAMGLILYTNPTKPSGVRATWLGQAFAVGSGRGPSKTLGEDAETPKQATAVTQGVLGGDCQATERVVVMGDSHAMMWGNQISKACEQLGVAVRFWCANGTSPFTSVPPAQRAESPGLTSEELLAFDRARLASLEIAPPGLLILAARWSAVGDFDLGSQFVTYANALGWRVLIVEQPPELWFGDVDALEFVAAQGWTPDSLEDLYVDISIHRERFDRSAALLSNLCAKGEFCSLMPVADLLQRGRRQQVWMAHGEICNYFDDDHLSEEGAALFRERLADTISSMLGLGNPPKREG
jgi:peptidoglycan/LPS O-acetylase OafA/YrhL